MTDPKTQNMRIWDARYEGEDYFYGTAPNAWLASKAHYLTPGMRVLVPADGEGRNSVWCAEQGMVVDAFDFAPTAVEKAHRLAREKGVAFNYALAAMDEWEWHTEAYDAVILIFMNFGTPNMRSRLFEQSMAVLKPGGLLLLHGYTTRQLAYNTGGPRVEEQLYTEPLLREAFASMDMLEMLSYEAPIYEGEGHKGMSALVGMVAQKPVEKPL